MISGALVPSYNLLVTGPGNLLYLQLSDTSSGANEIVFYDSISVSAVTRTRLAYTGRSYTLETITHAFTSGVGRSESQSEAVRSSAARANAEATIAMGRLYTVTLPADGTVIFDPVSPILFSYGIVAVADDDASYVLDYVPMIAE